MNEEIIKAIERQTVLLLAQQRFLILVEKGFINQGNENHFMLASRNAAEDFIKNAYADELPQEPPPSPVIISN